ncbi:hypothetical protein FACS1894152_3640 [Bacilli bacterium]|nr:hypothetical protein FACS1894152_3640 [Bacilli bacterium]
MEGIPVNTTEQQLGVYGDGIFLLTPPLRMPADSTSTPQNVYGEGEWEDEHNEGGEINKKSDIFSVYFQSFCKFILKTILRTNSNGRNALGQQHDRDWDNISSLTIQNSSTSTPFGEVYGSHIDEYLVKSEPFGLMLFIKSNHAGLVKSDHSGLILLVKPNFSAGALLELSEKDVRNITIFSQNLAMSFLPHNDKSIDNPEDQNAKNEISDEEKKRKAGIKASIKAFSNSLNKSPIDIAENTFKGFFIGATTKNTLLEGNFERLNILPRSFLEEIIKEFYTAGAYGRGLKIEKPMVSVIADLAGACVASALSSLKSGVETADTFLEKSAFPFAKGFVEKLVESDSLQDLFIYSGQELISGTLSFPIIVGAITFYGGKIFLDGVIGGTVGVLTKTMSPYLEKFVNVIIEKVSPNSKEPTKKQPVMH